MRGVFLYDNALDDEGVDITALSGGSLANHHEDALIDRCPFTRWGPSPYSAETWVKVDLGSEQTVKGFGIINHNAYVAGMAYVTVGGNNDGGATYTPVDTLFNLNSTDHDPCAALIFSSAVTYRYWKFTFGLSTSAHLLGGLYLARGVNELAETPDTPFQEDQHNQIVSDLTDGGGERRQVRGEPYYNRSLRWKGTTTAVAQELRTMWLRQHGRSRPFLYAAHDSGQPTAQDQYIPEVVRFARLTVRDLAPGGRYSVVMTLVGQLKIGY